MKYYYYIFILLGLLGCKSEETAQTILVINNHTSNSMKIKFFEHEQSRNAIYSYSESFILALESDTVYLNAGEDMQLILAASKQIPTDVLSAVIDSINIIQIGSDSVFRDDKFVGFDIDSLKYKKDKVINTNLNVFTDLEAWDESTKENSWSANLNSHEEVVHFFTFNVPDLFDTGR
ncbi:MAG: hypothetical protein MI866_08870 [Bacteroidales bacterium]|nr:hypothetical protein [Bacteroidales bacterium]